MRLRSSAGGFPGGGDANVREDPLVLARRRLVDAGRLSRDDVAEIAAYQDATGAPFGEAAVALGKLDESDLDDISVHQPSAALLIAGDERVSPLVRAAFSTSEPYVEQIRAVRSKVLTSARADSNRQRATKVAAVGVGADDETAVLAANLATVFAQLGSRTLLVDCGLADPALDSLFKVPGNEGVAQALQSPRGQAAAFETAIASLAVVPAGDASAGASGLLHKQSLVKVIDRWSISAEQVIAILPAMENSALSLGTILAGFDGVVLVTRRDVTRIQDVRRVIDTLDAHSVPILGSVIS